MAPYLIDPIHEYLRHIKFVHHGLHRLHGLKSPCSYVTAFRFLNRQPFPPLHLLRRRSSCLGVSKTFGIIVSPIPMKVACLPNVQPDVAANFLYSRLLLSQRHSCQRNPCGKRSFSASLCLVQALWQRIAARCCRQAWH